MQLSRIENREPIAILGREGRSSHHRLPPKRSQILGLISVLKS
jgi:hypothetical protein